jgi:hypothetical protein
VGVVKSDPCNNEDRHGGHEPRDAVTACDAIRNESLINLVGITSDPPWKRVRRAARAMLASFDASNSKSSIVIFVGQ